MSKSAQFFETLNQESNVLIKSQVHSARSMEHARSAGAEASAEPESAPTGSALSQKDALSCTHINPGAEAKD